MNTELKPMWWVLEEKTERTIAICNNQKDAENICRLYETYENIKCKIGVAFTR